MRTIDGTLARGSREHDTALTPVCVEVNEWTPILDGNVYCSRRCGFRCKKTDYDAAVAAADAAMRELGEGWIPHVWENAGWHSEVRRGSSSVSINRRNGTFRCDFDSVVGQFIQTAGTATDAVRLSISMASTSLRTLERQIMNSGIVGRTLIDRSKVTDL